MEKSGLFMIVTKKIEGVMGVYGYGSISVFFIPSYAEKLPVAGVLYDIVYGKLLVKVSVWKG